MLERLGHRLSEAAERDPAAVRMLLDGGREPFLDEQSRAAGRGFREALEQIVVRGKSDGAVRAGPADLWAGVWLAVVEFVLRRVSTREWTPEQPQVQSALDAAWAAIRADGPERPAAAPPER